MNTKKATIIMVGMSVLSMCILGGLIYSSKKVEAQEKQDKQILFAQIRTQQDQEENAKNSKADAPSVTVTPSRVQAEVLTLTKQNTPTKVSTAATPIVSQTVGTATIKLSEMDIKRLQSYEQYTSIDNVNISISYKSFGEMYKNQKSNCDGLLKKFSALTLYDKAKVDWLTSPKLVYKSAISHFCVRGIVSVTYYGENNLKLTPNVKYQRDVEYRLRNSVTNGKSTLKLESTNYLSNFKAVK